MIDIHTIQALNRPDKIALTEHARIRLSERNIKIDDVMNCIESGEIIKQYEDDQPFPSCLLLGNDVNNNCMHVVLSTDHEYIYLITAYYPDREQWESDYRTKRRL